MESCENHTDGVSKGRHIDASAPARLSVSSRFDEKIDFSFPAERASLARASCLHNVLWGDPLTISLGYQPAGI